MERILVRGVLIREIWPQLQHFSVVFEDFFQLGPDRLVAFFVFLFGAGIDRHDEGFADFRGALLLEEDRSEFRERIDGSMR
jgi:hypothetical protein